MTNISVEFSFFYNFSEMHIVENVALVNITITKAVFSHRTTVKSNSIFSIYTVKFLTHGQRERKNESRD